MRAPRTIFPATLLSLIAATACVALLGTYVAGVLRSARRGAAFGAGAAVLYGALYGIVQSEQNALLLVTDLEALHPFLRIGAIESQLQGKFHVPTIFLYPGVRTGKTRLKFLGFYPEDGNYRSVHVGG